MGTGLTFKTHDLCTHVAIPVRVCHVTSMFTARSVFLLLLLHSFSSILLLLVPLEFITVTGPWRSERPVLVTLGLKVCINFLSFSIFLLRSWCFFLKFRVSFSRPISRAPSLALSLSPHVMRCLSHVPSRALSLVPALSWRLFSRARSLALVLSSRTHSISRSSPHNALSLFSGSSEHSSRISSSSIT